MITLIIIAITAGISLFTMNDHTLKQRYVFSPYAIKHHREWWRFFTHGVLHADFVHLLVNMLSFYFFGPFVEREFKSYDVFGPQLGTVYYILLYVTSLVMSSLYTYFKNKDNPYYSALGASGAVSAVVFASILLFPTHTLIVYIIPMPAWLYGPLYLVYCSYSARRNRDNIGHDAHFYGAIYGFLLPIVLMPALMFGYNGFIMQMKEYFHLL